MGLLLDTCVVSEFMKKTPDTNVVKWFRSQAPESLFLSVFTTGELRRGIERLPVSRRRSDIETWYRAFTLRYRSSIVLFDLSTSEIWGKVKAHAENAGRPLSVIDSLIAASAIKHDHVIATRNVQDFDRTGVTTFDPWEFQS